MKPAEPASQASRPDYEGAEWATGAGGGSSLEAAWHILIPARNWHRWVAPCHTTRQPVRTPFSTLIAGSIQRGSRWAQIRLQSHILTTLAAASPAAALDRLIDTGNDHWVEVTGEGSVNAAPDFARVTLGVTNTGRRPVRPWPRTRKRPMRSFAHQVGGRRSRRHPDLRSLDFADVLATRARPKTAPTITGYSVSNNVTVMVRDIPRLGGVLDKAVAAGANSIYGVGFATTIRAHSWIRRGRWRWPTPGARPTSTRPPHGPRIGRLMVLTEEPSRAPIVSFPRAYTAPAFAPTPIEAGEDKLTVIVTTRFELTQ